MGLDYAMNRYFANTSGRFVSVDQGRFFPKYPGTFNRYVYTSNDPINKIDPDGLEEEEPDVFERSHAVIRALQGRVRAGEITDCEALAQFSIWADSATDNWVTFAALFWQLTAQPLKYRDNHDSAFKEQYRAPDNGDQTHHFGGFFWVGALTTIEPISSAVFHAFGPLAREIYDSIRRDAPIDYPDIRLGHAAADLGQDVAMGRVQPHEVADRIRKDLCDK